MRALNAVEAVLGVNAASSANAGAAKAKRLSVARMRVRRFIDAFRCVDEVRQSRRTAPVFFWVLDAFDLFSDSQREPSRGSGTLICLHNYRRYPVA
jgi:hypothetical protein